jgi:hypothetical protein
MRENLKSRNIKWRFHSNNEVSVIMARCLERLMNNKNVMFARCILSMKLAANLQIALLLKNMDIFFHPPHAFMV